MCEQLTICALRNKTDLSALELSIFICPSFSVNLMAVTELE